jgi:hypothetical protein
MLRRFREWWLRRRENRSVGEASPVLDTPEKEADLIKLIQSGQSNQPGRPQ